MAPDPNYCHSPENPFCNVKCFNCSLFPVRCDVFSSVVVVEALGFLEVIVEAGGRLGGGGLGASPGVAAPDDVG